MLQTTEKINSVDLLFKKIPVNIPKENDLIEGTVLVQNGSMLFIDLSPFGTGVIYGREFNNAREIIKSLNPGDKIVTKVTEAENELGYLSLSPKEARQEIVWKEAEEEKVNKTVLNLEVLDANKGGLILEWKGVQGFLPASQLKAEHFPRIEDGDKDKILAELKKLIGEKIAISIISANQKDKKLIFSEKGAETKEAKEIISKYSIGDIIEGEITGVVEFGVFIKLEEGLEGLAHISELDWSLVENTADLFKVGETVKAQIINIKDGKISLSIKALKENPWELAQKKYSKGNIVKGVVIKFNKHGALVSVEEGVSGLAHVSEFETEIKMKQLLELGKSYLFQINLFEPKEQKMTLVYMDEQKETKDEANNENKEGE